MTFGNLGLPKEFDNAKLVPISGGHSGNSVFRVELKTGAVCVKQFSNMQDANREWNLLICLTEAGVRCVPAPLERYGKDGEILSMSWCPGESLGNKSFSQHQVDLFTESLIEFGSVIDDRLPAATNQTERIIERAIEARVAILNTGDPRFVDLHPMMDALLVHPEVADLVDGNATWLGRGDPNLANALWSDKVMFVDLEHTGYNDRCAELADLAEHLQSHNCDEDVWGRLWDQLNFDGEERRRISWMRGLTAVWWLSMLLTNDLAKRLNPPTWALVQANRARRLLAELI